MAGRRRAAGQFLEQCRDHRLKRSDVFSTSSSAGREPRPAAEEIIACSCYPRAQLNILQPKLVVTLFATDESLLPRRADQQDSGVALKVTGQWVCRCTIPRGAHRAPGNVIEDDFSHARLRRPSPRRREAQPASDHRRAAGSARAEADVSPETPRIPCSAETIPAV